MIYFVTNIASLDPWDLVGKEVAKSLSEFTEVKLLQRDRDATGVHIEAIAEEYRDLVSQSGGGVKPADGMIFHGSVIEAVNRIQRPDECSNRWNVALVWWPTDAISTYWVEGLNLYDEVWVTNLETLHAFETAGVENARTIRTPVHDTHQNIEIHGLAIGKWGFPDNLENIMEYIESVEENKHFHLVCTDIPFSDKKGMLKLFPKTKASVSVSNQLNIPASEWTELMNKATYFYDACTYLGGSPWLHFHPRLSYVRSLVDGRLSEVDDAKVEGVVAPQKWRKPSSEFPLDLVTSIKSTSYKTSKSAFQQLVMELNEKAKNKAKQGEGLKLGVIIPFGNLDPIALEIAVLRAESYLDEQDIVIVSELSEAPFKEYEHHVHTETDTWNMSLARNQGIRYAKEQGCDLIFFHDVDIVPTRRLFLEIKERLRATPNVICIPQLANEERQPSGLTAMTVETAYKVGGFDEGYQEYGSEDIDFIFRAKAQKDIATIQLLNSVIHEPHPQRRIDDSLANEGLERFKKRGQGKPEPIITEGLK